MCVAAIDTSGGGAAILAERRVGSFLRTAVVPVTVHHIAAERIEGADAGLARIVAAAGRLSGVRIVRVAAPTLGDA
jgi:hypothetical protein